MCEDVQADQEVFVGPDTRFMKIFFMLKHFKRMMGGLRATVANDAYKSLYFDDNTVDGQIEGDEIWVKIQRVLLAAPLLLPVRLGDTPGATISKLRKTVL